MYRIVAVALLALAANTPVVCAQSLLNPNERVAQPQTNKEDKEDIYLLDFKFKDPRTISVDIPGRGKTLVWYMWYEVSNRTGAPRFFHPTFELVTLDKNTKHVDEVLPTVEEAIRRLEDNKGYLGLKNSVTIGKDPIPASKPDSEIGRAHV